MRAACQGYARLFPFIWLLGCLPPSESASLADVVVSSGSDVVTLVLWMLFLVVRANGRCVIGDAMQVLLDDSTTC